MYALRTSLLAKQRSNKYGETPGEDISNMTLANESHISSAKTRHDVLSLPKVYTVCADVCICTAAFVRNFKKKALFCRT